MLHARLTPGAVAHWGDRLAAVLEATSVIAVVAPIVPADEVRAALGDALARGDIRLERETIGMRSSGEDYVIRAGFCHVIRSSALLPFWLLPPGMLDDIVRLRRQVAESRNWEGTPSIESNIYSGIA